MWPPSERPIRSIRKCLLSRLGEAAFAQIATPNARTGRGFGTVLAQPGREGFELFPPIHSPRWMIADVLDGLTRSEEHTSELQSLRHLVCRLLLEKKYTLWAGIIGGAFLTTASHGTDHLIVQILLAALIFFF